RQFGDFEAKRTARTCGHAKNVVDFAMRAQHTACSSLIRSASPTTCWPSCRADLFVARRWSMGGGWVELSPDHSAAWLFERLMIPIGSGPMEGGHMESLWWFLFLVSVSASLLSFALMARWYVVPRLNSVPRATALLPLLLVNTFRTV